MLKLLALILLFDQSITGKVVSIADGDTITVLTNDQQQYKVRLAEIDAPEKKQAYGTVAKNALAEKVFGETVTVQYTEKDRYGRIVGYVKLNNRNINMEMVEGGYSWRYSQYSRDTAFQIAQNNARSNNRGLWADPYPTPPWEFRKEQKSAPKKPTTTKKKK
jgi:micrococcal nuclease